MTVDNLPGLGRQRSMLQMLTLPRSAAQSEWRTEREGERDPDAKKLRGE